MSRLTQTTKDSTYLTFHAVRRLVNKSFFSGFWIPNEQRISFRWVFQYAIPILIRKWLRERVKFIMKDGDPQQRNEVIYISVLWHMSTRSVATSECLT